MRRAPAPPARSAHPRSTSREGCSKGRPPSRCSGPYWTRSTAARRPTGRGDGGPPFLHIPAERAAGRAGAAPRRPLRQEDRPRGGRASRRARAAGGVGAVAARPQTAARVGARALRGRRSAGQTGARDAPGRTAAVAARLYLLFPVRRAARPHAPRGLRRLSAVRPRGRCGGRAGRATTFGAGVLEARRMARAHARRAAARDKAGADLGDSGARQLAAALAGAPHEPNPDHLALIAERAQHLKLPRPVRLSQLEHGAPSPVIVVDRVGILADLYAVADVAFVGGGYTRAGLHSVLEPAVFGVPVTMGPHWHMSRDAALLIERGGAVALAADGRHPLHSQCLVWYHDPAAPRKAGAAGKRLVQEGRGAAERTTALVRELVER